MARFSISLKPAEEPPKPLTKIFNTFYPAHNSHNDKKSRLEQGGESDGMGWASLTSWPVIQPTHTHILTIRMHFNFPPCCVLHRGGRAGARVSHIVVVVVVELLQKCETANVKRNTEVNVVAPLPPSPSTPTQQTTHQTNPPQSVPLPALPFPSLPTLCTHSMPSTKLFNLLAIYYGSSLWDYRAASWIERGGRRKVAEVDYADSGQLLIKRVENPLCYGI